jgi:Histidine phosphatase superfamily (branch 2)
MSRRPWSWPAVGLLAALGALAGCGSIPSTFAHPPTAAQTPSVAAPSPPEAATPVRTTYGFYAPYEATATSVAKPPRGFTPFYLQDVGRHGSRASTNGKAARRVGALCEAASSSGRLTPLGTDFCADTQSLVAGMRRTGYGDLSSLGRHQWEQIGERTVDDYRGFFTAAVTARAPIRFVTSDVNRAQDSSDAFRDGLEGEAPGLDLTKRATDDELLRFPTPLSSPAKAEIERITTSPATRAAAADVLQRLFGATSTALGDARDVWDLYAIAPGMGLQLDAYLTRADAAQLATVDDAETFYRYGPGVEGSTEAFDSAAPLRADLLRVIRTHLDGDPTMATFRHAHAETVVPLATLLRLGPSSVPVPPGASPDAHGWRGSEEAEMAANIDVAAYRQGSTVLVTVRYNEAPVEVMGCQASTYGPYFYDLQTLEKCWS